MRRSQKIRKAVGLLQNAGVSFKIGSVSFEPSGKDAVEKINETALKSAEKALKEKDEVIADLSKEISKLYKMVHGDPILNMKSRREKKPDYPTIDNPEEVSVDEAVSRIRKALNEGHTVVVDYDDAADIINTHLLG